MFLAAKLMVSNETILFFLIFLQKEADYSTKKGKESQRYTIFTPAKRLQRKLIDMFDTLFIE